MNNSAQKLVAFARYVIAKFRQDKCTQMAASLTFDTLLSLVPLITIALTLFSTFPVFDDFSLQIKRFLLSNMLPETGGKMITRYVEQFAESATRLTAVGFAFLAITAMLIMMTMDNAFNTIWRISKPRPWLKRMAIYWAVIILAPLLIGASLSLTSWVVGLSMGYAKQTPMFGMLTLKIMPVILTTLAFSLLFRWVPNRHVSIRDALVGGVVAAVAFEAMSRGFGFFISHFSTYKLVYGAFASVPIFLLWVYFSWITILMGALIAASLSRWQHRGTQQLNAAEQFYFSVRILDLMHEGLVEGQLQTVSSLSKRLNLAFEVTEMLLEKLQNADMVRKLAGRGWKMIRTPQHISIYELTNLFLLDVSNLPAQQGDAEIHAWFASVLQGLEKNKSQMLSTLITR